MSVLQAIFVDTDGNISCRLGDSGVIYVTGIPTDDNYTVSLGVVNPPDKKILNEVSVNSNNAEEVELPISVAFTESLGIGRFYYGIKLTGTDLVEQTVIPNAYMDEDGQIEIARPNTFTVKPKLAEGL
jgi:hypothetical protein